MRDQVAAQLRRLNSEFYQTFGQSFADTRNRIQPGIQKLLGDMAPEASQLDLGCGHGQIARWRAVRGDSGYYCGVDSSQPLLDLTGDIAANGQVEFVCQDLSTSDWGSTLATHQILLPPKGFDWVTAFAVMHHLPGQTTRQQFVRQAAAQLKPGGQMAVSNWNFLASQRLRERILPWETVGLTSNDVEPGDYLLDWRRGGRGVRYVHHFTEDSLASLALDAGLKVISTFYSDGETGDLGLYQVWLRET